MRLSASAGAAAVPVKLSPSQFCPATVGPNVVRLKAVPSAAIRPFPLRAMPVPVAKRTATPGWIASDAPLPIVTSPTTLYGEPARSHVVLPAIAPETSVITQRDSRLSRRSCRRALAWPVAPEFFDPNRPFRLVMIHPSNG